MQKHKVQSVCVWGGDPSLFDFKMYNELVTQREESFPLE